MFDRIAANHGLQRRPRIAVIEVVSRSRGPAEPYRSRRDDGVAAERTLLCVLCASA